VILQVRVCVYVCVYVLRVCSCGVSWDVAAGALIVLEAGGAICDPAGACVCVFMCVFMCCVCVRVGSHGTQQQGR